MESVLLTTADGHELAGDLLLPEPSELAGGVIGGAVVCHPHPQYGGNRFNPVVDAVWRALAHRGWASLRFDFRADFDGGRGERDDVMAAVDELARRVASAPIVVVGYSFGAAVALATSHPRVGAVAAIAPPVSMMGDDPVDPGVPVHLIVPAHDQFGPPDAAAAIAANWREATVETIEGADHFLVGRAVAAAEAAAEWLTRLARSGLGPEKSSKSTDPR